LVILVLAAPGFALEPNDLALVVNKNLPDSVELARFYAKARSVPTGRIIQLDLPINADEIPFEDYERLVAQPVRQFLESNGIQDQVKCLVTFHGVPLRVAKRAATPQETAELARVRQELQRVQGGLARAVAALERMALAGDASFKPPVALASADALARRADHATRALSARLESLDDAAQRGRLQADLDTITKFLNTPVGDPPATSPSTAPATAQADVDPAQLPQLMQHGDDPAARQAVRTLARRTANPFAYEKVLQEHAMHLTPEHSDAAIDSELALLWLGRQQGTGWQLNPLGYPFVNSPDRPRVVMVMRLDAPSADAVRKMIETSLAVERDGLTGKFVIDSRGIQPRQGNGSPDAFGAFDQRLRDLAALVREKTKLELVLDEKPDVLRPTPQVEGVALYCGWYSVAKYVPSMKLVPGAVGYHIASYELTSLRDETNTGWGRGLLSDGAVATLGPVSEPLLHAFAAPDDFFPLLLTGRLTLAEVYWRTCPLTSWKMCAIGDPLYTPFKQNPALRVEDLPERLRPLFEAPETKPQTKPR
jgi:uncharacterized protein (TIGR03790 family)